LGVGILNLYLRRIRLILFYRNISIIKRRHLLGTDFQIKLRLPGSHISLHGVWNQLIFVLPVPLSSSFSVFFLLSLSLFPDPVQFFVECLHFFRSLVSNLADNVCRKKGVHSKSIRISCRGPSLRKKDSQAHSAV
jgi:hypothetical protein